MFAKSLIRRCLVVAIATIACDAQFFPQEITSKVRKESVCKLPTTLDRNGTSSVLPGVNETHCLSCKRSERISRERSLMYLQMHFSTHNSPDILSRAPAHWKVRSTPDPRYDSPRQPKSHIWRLFRLSCRCPPGSIIILREAFA